MVRRPHGYGILQTPEGRPEEFDTLQCCHCGMHWRVQPGSGVMRGFCQRCNRVHCGGPDCWECRPQERQLDEIERAARGHPTEYAKWCATFRPR